MEQNRELTEDEVVGALVERLRVELGVEDISPGELRRLLGASAMLRLRDYYFPLYQPHTVRNPDPSARMSTRVAVPDQFEQAVVLAIAPRDIQVNVVVEGETLQA